MCDRFENSAHSLLVLIKLPLGGSGIGRGLFTFSVSIFFSSSELMIKNCATSTCAVNF